VEETMRDGDEVVVEAETRSGGGQMRGGS